MFKISSQATKKSLIMSSMNVEFALDSFLITREYSLFVIQKGPILSFVHTGLHFSLLKPQQ